jgi:FtsP/CotA-like multicopper oxidase with cupredoxin domain
LTLSRYLYNGPNGLQQWTRAYNNELSGPTIRVKPGDTLHIRPWAHCVACEDARGRRNTATR